MHFWAQEVAVVFHLRPKSQSQKNRDTWCAQVESSIAVEDASIENVEQCPKIVPKLSESACEDKFWASWVANFAFYFKKNKIAVCSHNSVLKEDASGDFPIVCLRISTALMGISSERRIYENSAARQTCKVALVTCLNFGQRFKHTLSLLLTQLI